MRLLLFAWPLLLALLSSCGTPVQKLRWLRTGVYESDLHDLEGLFLPPPPSSSVAPPKAGASEYTIRGSFGEFNVRKHGPSPTLTNHLWIPRSNQIPFFVADKPARALEIPGFLYGIDLRPWSKIAFVLHLDTEMCQGVRSPSVSERFLGRNPPTQMDFLTRQAAFALRGLPPSTQTSFFAGAASLVIRFSPRSTLEGRDLAAQWLTQQFCFQGRSLVPLMRRALADKPDLVVLLSEFGEVPDITALELQRRYPDTYRTRVQDFQNLWDRLPRWKPLPPILTVSWRASNAARTIAEITGGASVAHNE